MQDWAIWLVLPSRLWEYICMTLKLKLFFSHSVVSDSLWPHGLYPGRFVSMGLISGEEYQSELTFPSPGDLRDLGIEPMSPAWQVDSLPLSHQGRAKVLTGWYKVLSSFFPQHRDIQGCVLLCSPYKLELPSALLPQRLCGAEHTTHSHWIYNKSKKLSLVALFHWSFGVKFLLKFRLALLWIVRISFSSFANSHILRKKSPDHLKYTHTHTDAQQAKHQRYANENHNEISTYICQNAYYQKEHKQILGRMHRKSNPCTCNWEGKLVQLLFKTV